MAQDSFKGIVFGMILFATFATLFLGWAIDLGADYGKSSDEISGGAFDTTAVDTMLGSINDNAQTEKTKFESGEMTNVDNAVGVFSVMNSISSFLFTPWTLLSGILTNVLHVPVLFVNVILSLIILTIVFGIWRLVRAGD